MFYVYFNTGDIQQTDSVSDIRVEYDGTVILHVKPPGSSVPFRFDPIGSKVHIQESPFLISMCKTTQPEFTWFVTEMAAWQITLLLIWLSKCRWSCVKAIDELRAKFVQGKPMLTELQKLEVVQ